MAFLRLVEVLPPLFPTLPKSAAIAPEAALERFGEEVRSIRDYADLILVANVKNPGRLKFDCVHAAVMLQEDFQLDAAPVIVVRDQNRPQFLSTVLTAMSLELNSIMIAWGDDYPSSAGASNVRDFKNLADAIREAGQLRKRARSSTKILAPVDLDSLRYPRGIALAKERIRAGADMLLAQPPTTDSDFTFDRHDTLVSKAGLDGRVLLNVFPFKDEGDVRHYEKLFAWKLPRDLHAAAAGGEARLIALERSIVQRIRKEGYPGIYLTTRGSPSVAEKVLS